MSDGKPLNVGELIAQLKQHHDSAQATAGTSEGEYPGAWCDILSVDVVNGWVTLEIKPKAKPEE